MFDFQQTAEQLDRVALVIGLVVVFLLGARGRLRFGRVRFSLWTLLIVTTIVAIGLGLIMWEVRK